MSVLNNALAFSVPDSAVSNVAVSVMGPLINYCKITHLIGKIILHKFALVKNTLFDKFISDNFETRSAKSTSTPYSPLVAPM